MMDWANWWQAAAAEAVGGLVGATALYVAIRLVDRRRERRAVLDQLARATTLYRDGMTQEALAIATTLLEEQTVRRDALLLALVQRLVADCRARGDG